MAFHDSWLGKRGTSIESNFMGIQNKIIRVIPYTDFNVEVFWGDAVADRMEGWVADTCWYDVGVVLLCPAVSHPLPNQM